MFIGGSYDEEELSLNEGKERHYILHSSDAMQEVKQYVILYNDNCMA